MNKTRFCVHRAEMNQIESKRASYTVYTIEGSVVIDGDETAEEKRKRPKSFFWVVVVISFCFRSPVSYIFLCVLFFFILYSILVFLGYITRDEADDRLTRARRRQETPTRKSQKRETRARADLTRRVDGTIREQWKRLPLRRNGKSRNSVADNPSVKKLKMEWNKKETGKKKQQQRSISSFYMYSLALLYSQQMSWDSFSSAIYTRTHIFFEAFVSSHSQMLSCVSSLIL